MARQLTFIAAVLAALCRYLNYTVSQLAVNGILYRGMFTAKR